MTNEERKAWEEEVMVWARALSHAKEGYQPHGLATLILAADAELKRLREAVEWALQRGTWNHVDHPPSDREWEYYVTELRRRAGLEGR